MRTLIAIPFMVALGLGSATAQTTQTSPSQEPARQGQSSGNPAIKDPTPSSERPGTAATGHGGESERSSPVSMSRLEAGSNSFTEGQARSRLEAAGFSDVSGLAKDDQGIWRGQAQRDGKGVTVGLDYKGSVGTQ